MTRLETRARAAIPSLLLVAVALLAAAFTWAAGRRGLFPLDQSILFDGGWRVLSGQVPFRDFVAPVGPVAFWVQGGFFSLFGVSWSGYLASAALLDAIAVVLAFLVARALFPGEWWGALAAAAGTGAWFLPPSGTPWIDAVAFLFGLMAVLALLHGVGVGGPGAGGGSSGAGEGGVERVRRWDRVGWGAVAGAVGVAVFLIKQSAALALVPVLVAVLVAAGWESVGELRRARNAGTGARRFPRVGEPGRILAGLVVGAAVAAGAFGLWLVLVADPGLFLRHVLSVPATEGWSRLLERPWGSVVVLLTGMGPRPVRGILLAAVLVAGVVLVRRTAGGTSAPARNGSQSGASPRLRWAALVVVALFLAQNLFLATANNQPEISLPFAGLIVALGARVGWGEMERWEWFRGRAQRRVVGAVLVTLLVIFFASAVDTAWSRDVHEVIPPGARFDRSLEVDGLETLRWGEPTLLMEEEGTSLPVTAANVEALVEHLRRRGEPFFVFPDWTLLYGVVGTLSPQPLLWFHPGLTYSAGGDPELDRWIVASLERHGVSTVVLEEAAWFGTGERLADFPQLAAWIAEGFGEEERIGPFRLLHRR